MTSHGQHQYKARTLSAGLLLVAVVLGTGCAAVENIVGQPVNTSPTQAEPGASETAPRPTLDAGQVVATGELAGDATGTVTITATGDGGFGVRIDNLRTELDGLLSPYLSTQTFVPGEYCASTRAPMVGYGQFTPAPTYSFSLDGFGHGGSSLRDPGYLDDLILTRSGADLDDCFYAVAAVAPLTWMMPEMRPGLVVADSGPIGGAQGAVELAGGRPLAYTVASEDMLSEIAARFGLTVEDVAYLNPARDLDRGNRMLFVDEVLNLDPASR